MEPDAPNDPTAPEIRALAMRAAGPGATAADHLALRRAADAVFAQHHDRIYGLCLRLTRRPERAAELTQDTFVTAYPRLADYQGEGSFYAWLYGIARNLCMRSNAKKREALADDELFDRADPHHGALASMREDERRRLLDEASRAVLDPVEQEAVTMRYTLGMSVEDITQALGLEEASGARGLLQTCRRKLKRELTRRLVELGHGQSLLFGSIVPD